MKNYIKKSLCFISMVLLLSVGAFTQATEDEDKANSETVSISASSNTLSTSATLSAKEAKKAEKERLAAEKQAAKVAAKEAKEVEKKAAQEAALQKKLDAMSEEDKAAYLQKIAEKEAALAEKQAAKEAKLAEKEAIQQEKQAEKERLAAEKQAEKEAKEAEKKAAQEAALQKKLDAMSEEDRAAYLQKMAEKEAALAEKQAAKEAKLAAKQEAKEQRAAEKQAQSEKIKAAFANPDENGMVTFEASTGYVVTVPKVDIVYEEGLAMSQITRIETQENRSNYVLRDNLVGAYFTVKTSSNQLFNPMMRVAAYTPLNETFNGVPQTVQQRNVALDGFIGLDFRYSVIDFAFLTFAPGLHMAYEYTDRFNYLNTGLEVRGGLELPISYQWTILGGCAVSFDYGNLGSNKYIEPYNYVWQWDLDLGVRYSTKVPNKYNYLHETAQTIQDRADAKAAKKEAKAQAKAEKKAAADEKKAAKKAEAEEKKAAEAERKAAAKSQQKQ